MGEQEYFSTLASFTCIPSDMKSALWDDMGISWMEISDFELFTFLAPQVDVEHSKIFFGDLDFTKFQLIVREQNNEIALGQYAADGSLIVIDKGIYLRIVNVLRTLHGITPKIEIASTKTVRRILLEIDREEREKAKNTDFSSNLQPLISALINSDGFKYDLSGIQKLPYYTFLDSIKRIALIKNTSALLQGCYAGWIDSSKINNKNLDWLKKIEETKSNMMN